MTDLGRSSSYWFSHWTERRQWSHWCLWNRVQGIFAFMPCLLAVCKYCVLAASFFWCLCRCDMLLCWLKQKQVCQQDAYLAIRPAYPRGCCPQAAKGAFHQSRSNLIWIRIRGQPIWSTNFCFTNADQKSKVKKVKEIIVLIKARSFLDELNLEHSTSWTV